MVCPVPKNAAEKQTSPPRNQARFRNALPVPAVEAAVAVAAAPLPVAGAFFVVAVPATAFLVVPMTLRFPAAADWAWGGLGAAPGGAVAGRFLTTVEVLASLDSLLPLALRAVRVAGLGGGWAAGGAATAAVTVAPRFLLAAVAPAAVAVFPLWFVELEAAVLEVAVAALRAVVVVVGGAATRADRVFSATLLLGMLVATAAVLFGVPTGRAALDLLGVATVLSRGVTLELEVVGDKTCPGLRETSRWPRIFLLGVPIS